MNASDIAAQEFPVVRKGYDPTAVRAFLARLSAAGLLGDGELVALEQAAQVDAERVRAEVEAEAADIRAQAEADAEQIRSAADLALAEAAAVHEEGVAAAKAIAAEAVEQAERILADADAIAATRIADAERAANERAEVILEQAKVRLQRMLDAEAEVHVRLSAAFSSVNAPSTHPLQRDDEALLDLAFAEFFTSDIEHDESRAWILSDHNAG